jgi:hypothetical protein
MNWRDSPYLVMLADADPAYRRALDAVGDEDGALGEPPGAVADDTMARVLSCPHLRGGDCRCGLDTCTFPWRRRKVSASDCLACVRAGRGG